MKIGRAIGVLAAIAVTAWRATGKRRTRPASPGKTLPNLIADQKRIWSYPLKAARDGVPTPALLVIGTTAALFALDPVLAPWLRDAVLNETPFFRRFNEVLSGRNMARAINAVPLSFYAGGALCGSSYGSQTGLLAGEAAANAEILAIAMKYADRRMRPTEAGLNGDFTHTWFRTKNRAIDGPGCFPSGHTAAAFAMATVFADRYQGHRWAPGLAFGLAGMVGLSRITTRSHFPSDVFFGAALGYSIGHFVILPRSRATLRGFR
jgi:membrane-associated phospholipid phosphatase